MSTLYILVLLISCVCCNIADEYVTNPADGYGYKLMYTAQPWDKARDNCAVDGAKLAVPKSEEQFKFIQKIVRGMQYRSVVDSEYKLLVWLGINNLEKYTEWKNIDGENINDSSYHTWAGGNGRGYSDDPAQPHCVGLDGANDGLRDYWCHKRQPYICEIQTSLH